jgi:hypothetical protein
VALKEVPPTSEGERAVHQGRMGFLRSQKPGPESEYELRQASWRECSGQSYP